MDSWNSQLQILNGHGAAVATERELRSMRENDTDCRFARKSGQTTPNSRKEPH